MGFKNINKFTKLITLSVIFFLLCISPVKAAVDETRASDTSLKYRILNVVEKTAEITGYISGTDIVIPDIVDINGKPYEVVSIGVHAFNNSPIISCTMGNKISKIGQEAFSGCKELCEIEFGASFKPDYIMDDAFIGCTSLKFFSVNGDNPNYSSYDGIIYNKNFSEIKMVPPAIEDVKLYPELSDIVEKAFYNCFSLRNVNIPESVVSIQDYAFYGCSSLWEMDLPEGLSSLGNYAFYRCSLLKSVNIPNGISSIGEHTFDGCYTLKEVNLPQDLMSIGSYAFRNIDINKIDLPESLIYIGDYAFSGCSALSSVSFPKGLTYLGESAFNNCTRLEYISFPEKINSIGSYTFSECTSLKEVEFHEGITSIGDYAFSGCSYLENISLPEGLNNIGKNAFSRCSRLSVVELPESIGKIEERTFYNSGLESIRISSQLVSIGDFAFYNCKELKEISLPQSLTHLGKGVFSESGLMAVEIPGLLDTIPKQAFQNCISLTTVTIPQSVTDIETGAFKGCPNITDFKVAENNTCYFSDGPILYNKEKTVLLCWPSAKGVVVIEEGVEEIKDDVFSNNLSIINLTIPPSVKSIGSYFCYNATNLLYVYCYPTVPPELGYQSFYYDDIDEYEYPIWEGIRCKIFVPKSSFTAYVNSNNWNRCYIFAMDLENGVEALPEDEISEPVSYTVFSTDGRQLLKDANIDTVRSLAPGIYIVNGKKVVL